MINKFVILLLCIASLGCAKKFEIEGFDQQAFQEDQNGCKGIRQEMHDIINKIKPQFLGHNQGDIISLLGLPDQRELAGRGQKFFIYFIGPSPKCEAAGTNQSPLTMYIRFSALDQVTETSFKNY